MAIRKKKKTTLDSLAALIIGTNAEADKKFAALAEDIADIKEHMATKEDVHEVLGHVVAMHDQMNNMEAELKIFAREKLPERLGNVEKELFGASRAPKSANA